MPTTVLLRGAMLHCLIRNSPGSKLFDSLPAMQDGVRVDLVQEGNLSCALFVSRLLALSNLLDAHAPFARVDSLEGLLRKADFWKEVSVNAPARWVDGSVIFWAAPEPGGHPHVGFSIKGGEATVHHSSTEGTPIITPLNMMRLRVRAVYEHTALREEV